MKSTLIKTVLLAIMMSGFVITNQALAVPRNNSDIGVGIQNNSTTVKKQKNNKKKVTTNKKKKPVKVQQNNPQTVQQNTQNLYFFSEQDETAAQYWAREQMRDRQLAVSREGLQAKPVVHRNPTPSATKKPIAKAKDWVGYHAKRDRNELKRFLSEGNHTKVDPVSIAWCAAFMNAVLKSSGYEGTNSLLARSFLSYGTVVKEPQQGDIVVFTRGRSSGTGHVAFFDGYEYINNIRYIRAVGGNQNKSVTVGLYPAHRLIGVRRIA